MIIRLFTTDEQSQQEVDVGEYKDNVILMGKPDHILPQHIALYSTVRNRGSLRVHHMLRLLVQYHLPALYAHLQKAMDWWWYPRCYDMEKEEDFITVTH